MLEKTDVLIRRLALFAAALLAGMSGAAVGQTTSQGDCITSLRVWSFDDASKTASVNGQAKSEDVIASFGVTVKGADKQTITATEKAARHAVKAFFTNLKDESISRTWFGRNPEGNGKVDYQVSVVGQTGDVTLSTIFVTLPESMDLTNDQVLNRAVEIATDGLHRISTCIRE